jgi:hypothetical protein
MIGPNFGTAVGALDARKLLIIGVVLLLIGIAIGALA